MASAKKIGVLTFHRCINYGSYWQARSLVEGLRAQGADAVLLDYPSPLVETRVALRPTLPTPVPREDVAAYKRKIRRFEREFDRLPLSRPFDLSRPETMEPLDAVVVGSDEVWNLRHPWYAGLPAFWGQGLPAATTVAYAASFGNYSCWEGIGEPFVEWLESFDALSVRDENSWWMLKNALGREVETVLDPTLAFDARPEGPWTGPEGPFALVYGHNFSPAYAESVRRWAAGRGLPLLSLGYRNDWADLQWLDAGPHDFAHAVARAEAVATNFFHGCAFAIREAKPFACEGTPYRSIKVRGLMELFGGEDRIVSDGEIGDRLDEAPDFASRRSALRTSSQSFLERALGLVGSFV